MTHEVVQLRDEPRKPLLLIDPQRLHEVWPEVKAGLEATKAKLDPAWIVEDIYAAIRAGAATLVMSDEAKGFAVLQKQARPYGWCVLVWVLYAPGELDRIRGSLYGPLEVLAREAGAQKLEMHGRRGWERDGFWQAREVVFTHDL